MKKIKTTHLLDGLAADVREIIKSAHYLQTLDPALLLQTPSPGKWSVIQVLEHLNSYGRYYLLAIERSLETDKGATEHFRPGWLGEYFTRLMKPKNGVITKKMQAPRGHRPPHDLDAMPVLKEFLEQQNYLLKLLELAASKNIGAVRTPVSISRFIRLKTGDTFRFLIAHEQRHFVQIDNTLLSIGTVRDIFQEARLAR